MPTSPDDSPRKDPPLIGILASLLVKEDQPLLGIERSYVNHDYVSAVEAAGGVPLLLPVVADAGVAARQVAAIDGLILSGGYDPSPLLFGEDPDRRIEAFFPEMDEHQLAAIRCAAEAGLPILGICRGLQILNVAFGGSLYQDLSLIPGSHLQHQQKSRKQVPTHHVRIEAGTTLAGVFGTTELLVNSFHHLAVKKPAPGFRVSAVAPDGVVEAMEREDGSAVLAVQWHPEMMAATTPAMRAPFDWIVREARAARARAGRA